MDAFGLLICLFGIIISLGVSFIGVMATIFWGINKHKSDQEIQSNNFTLNDQKEVK